MKLTKWKIMSGAFVLVAALLLGVGVAGFAQQGPERHWNGGGGPHGGPGGFVPFLRDLNLSVAQKTQVKQIMDGFESSTKPLRDRLDALHESEVSTLFKDGAFDEAAVRASAQERANVMVELDVARARMMSQVYAILTPEQKTLVAQRRQQMEQKRQEWKQKQAGQQPDDNQ
jgi:protein CpxP